MIIERALNQQYLSNSFVVADQAGGHCVIIDAGGPAEPLDAFIERNKLTVTHLLCTHHHVDHVSFNDHFKKRYGCPIFVPAAEAELFHDPYDETLVDNDIVTSGQLRIRGVHTPGHTRGMMAFVVDRAVFTGDTLFKGAVGGTLAPGHSSFEDIQGSIMDTLMKLPHELTVYPGHTEFTTIAQEWEHNPFIRIWRGVDEPGTKRCTAMGQPADLILRARDYDGGTKCWVRFDDGADEIVPGSQVVDAVS